MDDGHEGRCKSFYWHRSRNRVYHRTRNRDPGYSYDVGQERLNFSEKHEDDNSREPSSSSESVETNRIRQSYGESTVDNLTPKLEVSSGASPVMAPESCSNLRSGSTFDSQRLVNHEDRRGGRGRGFDRGYSGRSGGCQSSDHTPQHYRARYTDTGSSFRGEQESLKFVEKCLDSKNLSESSSYLSAGKHQIRDNPEESMADKWTPNLGMSSGLSPITPESCSNLRPGPNSASQPFTDNGDRRGGRGRGLHRGYSGRSGGWQSIDRTPRQYQTRFTDTGSSSHGEQERSKFVEKRLESNIPGEPSSYASINKHQLGEKPKESIADNGTLQCHFVKLDLSPCTSSGTEPITPVSDGKSSKSEQAFDICPIKKSGGIKLNTSLLDKNRERRKDLIRNLKYKKGNELRKGMILLKGYLSLSDQIKIVKQCRNLGVGTGGFYQPGYRDGAKLHLNMMCLGKNWDPETSQYGDRRPTDDAKPPVIPTEFFHLVQQAIEDSHSSIEEKHGVGTAEKQLPWMIPDICIVNFYASTGRLGLHQDRDESRESILAGLPVVSFSIGDSAEFLHGDQRDPDKAKMVVLESGDVLIFGGESRRVFHGVSAILPDTAPKSLLEDTNLRPGRLNLTFRQF